MVDPYEVLNVPSTASDEEVKRAYRELARKYHPDNYQDNPLADLAQEKMKEINAAYDEIQRQRSGRGSSQTARGPAGGQSRAGGSPLYAQVRMAIDRNDLNTAEQLLERQSDHDGEWNFLKGAVCCRRGMMDEARRYFETACQLSPDNDEYYRALQRVAGAQGAYRPEGYGPFSTASCGGGNASVCGKLACAYAAMNVCCGARFLWC